VSQPTFDPEARRPADLAGYYGEWYYENYAAGQSYRRDNPLWQAFFAASAEWIVRKLAPRTVLDAGCGVPMLVEELRDRGVEAWGVDLSEYAIAQAREDIRPFCKAASITDEFERDYDLILCIEVIEHLPERFAEQAVANLAGHTGQLLFSSTTDAGGDPSHVNVHPHEHWVGLFAQQGLYRDLDFDASAVAPDAMLLRRGGGPIDAIRAYERRVDELEREVARLELERPGTRALVRHRLVRLLGEDTLRYRLARSVVRGSRRLRRRSSR
jgi:SAM-dependent methyltransferase